MPHLSPAQDRIEGVIPILQTPFLDTGELDLDSLRREVAYACEAGAHGVAFPAFVGEWWKLSEDEIFTAAKVIADARTGDTRVIFNVTGQSTWLAVRQARRFLEIGCDALMCLPPFVLPPAPDAVIEHLRRVLSLAPKPHIIQYSAGLTGLKLNPESLRTLHHEFPHFTCIKVDFIPPGPLLTQLAEALSGEPFTFLIGYAGLQLEDSVRRGAHGLMGGAGHVGADLAVLRALRGPDPEAGCRAFERLLPMLNFEMQTVDMAIAVHKRLLRDQGVFTSDYIRPPGQMLDRYQIEELARHSRNLATLR